MGEIRNVSVRDAQDAAFMKRFDADNDGRTAGDEVKAMLQSAEIGGDANGKLSFDQQDALEANSPFQEKNLTRLVNWASDDPSEVQQTALDYAALIAKAIRQQAIKE
jgi:hypothetical protein